MSLTIYIFLLQVHLSEFGKRCMVFHVQPALDELQHYYYDPFKFASNDA